MPIITYDEMYVQGLYNNGLVEDTVDEALENDNTEEQDFAQWFVDNEDMISERLEQEAFSYEEDDMDDYLETEEAAAQFIFSLYNLTALCFTAEEVTMAD